MLLALVASTTTFGRGNFLRTCLTRRLLLQITRSSFSRVNLTALVRLQCSRITVHSLAGPGMAGLSDWKWRMSRRVLIEAPLPLEAAHAITEQLAALLSTRPEYWRVRLTQEPLGGPLLTVSGPGYFASFAFRNLAACAVGAICEAVRACLLSFDSSAQHS